MNNHEEIQEIKNSVTEIKDVIGRFNSRLDTVMDRISKLEDRSIEISPKNAKRKK